MVQLLIEVADDIGGIRFFEAENHILAGPTYAHSDQASQTRGRLVVFVIVIRCIYVYDTAIQSEHDDVVEL
ncbi:hypothetical protein D3C85_1699730 [compost metagenome]